MKEASASTAQEKYFLGAVVESSKDSVVTIDFNSVITTWNKAAEHLYGYPAHEALGKNLSLVMLPEDIKQLLVNIERIKSSKGVEIYDTIRVRKGGELINLEIVLSPVKNDEGEVIGVSTVARDITAWVKADNALKQSEEKFRALVSQTSVGIFQADLTGKIVFVNDTLCGMLGFKRSELLAQPFWSHTVDEELEDQMKLFENFKKTAQPFETEKRIVAKNGNIRWMKECISSIHNPEGELESVMGVFVDVTDQVLAKEKLQKSETRLQQTFTIETVGVIYFDLDGGIHDANPAFEKMSGFTREDFVTGKVRWDELTPPEFMPVTLRSREEFLANWQNTPYEKQYIRPDGTRWWGLFAGKRLSENECVEFVLDITIIKQVEEELERRVKQRTSEFEELNLQLQRSNHNLEQFAYAASHDLKEPIRKIQLFANRLKDGLNHRLSDIEISFFQRIDNSVNRMNRLIEDLLAYSHLSTQRRLIEEIDISELVGQVLTDLDFEIEAKRAAITVDGLCIVNGDKRQLQQVFQNVIGNALKYSKQDVPPVISIKCTKVNGEHVTLKSASLDKKLQYNQISIADNGIGFDQRDAERIFDMFTRLHGKSQFKGTGIGLAIVMRIIQNHDGFIEAESELGKGSIFKLYLPAKEIAD